MLDVTKTIKMDLSDPLVKEQVKLLCLHGRALVLMWQATKDNKYLKRARIDLARAKTLHNCGFVRPLGVLSVA